MEKIWIVDLRGYGSILIDDIAPVPQGHLGLAVMYPTVHDDTMRLQLVYEQGGDWNGFLEGQEYKLEELDYWMIDALKSAWGYLTEAGIIVDDDTIDYYRNWADTARQTLRNATIL